MASTTQTKTIIVRVDAGDSNKSLKEIANSLGGLNKKVGDIQGSFTKLRSIFTAAAGLSIFGFGIREVAQIADSFTQLNSRIAIFSGGAEKGARVFKSLVAQANETKTSIDDLATVFSRIQIATGRLNISTDAQLGITRALQQSFRITGANAQEAASATIQFSQALSSGQLRGQELRSILESNGVLADIFARRAEQAGLSVFKFAEAGRFTNKEVLTLLAQNFERIEKQAQGLSQTFGQTVTVAMNRVKVAIGRLNEDFNINGKFAQFVDYVINNGDKFAAVFIGLAFTAIPALIASLKGLAITAAAANPFFAIVAGLGAAAVLSAGGVKEFAGELKTLPPVLVNVASELARATIAILSLGTSLVFEDPITKALKGSEAERTKKIREVREQYKSVISELDPKFVGPPRPSEAQKQLEALQQSIRTIKDPVKTLQEQIGALQSSFNRGNIGVREFNDGIERLTIQRLNESLQQGSIDLVKYNKELRDLRIEGFARELEFGVVTISEFNENIRLFKIDEVNRKFSEGKISVAEFSNELVKLQNTGALDAETYTNGVGAGISNYIESIGTLSSQIAQATERTFSSLENSIFEATKSGRLNFAAFTQGVLDDLLKIAIRTQVVKPLAEGLLGGIFSGGAGGGGQLAGVAESGGTFLGNSGVTVTPFAKGGVVDSPTAFGFNGGIGVAGEAGPEAILPLSRGGSGELGVSAKGLGVTVNVVNQAGAEITTRETTGSNGEKAIEILIESKVKEGFARGRFDKTMKTAYGIERKGT